MPCSFRSCYPFALAVGDWISYPVRLSSSSSLLFSEKGGRQPYDPDNILILILFNCEKTFQAPLVFGCLKYQTYFLIVYIYIPIYIT